MMHQMFIHTLKKKNLIITNASTDKKRKEEVYTFKLILKI